MGLKGNDLSYRKYVRRAVRPILLNNTPAGAAPVGSITAIAKALLVDGEQFVISDGIRSKTFEFDKPVAATGSITAIAKALIANGETFTLKDGVNTVIFEFDDTGAYAGANTLVDLQAAVTPGDVRDAIITAVNGVGAGLTMTASIGGAAVVTLTNDATGTAGNQTQTETVADVTFVLTNMTGGKSSGVTGGTVAVDISGATTAGDVRDAIISAINGISGDYEIVASIGGAAVVTLTNSIFGALGNVAITDTVADVTFVHTGMAGGIGVATTDSVNGDTILEPWKRGDRLGFHVSLGALPAAQQVDILVEARLRSDGTTWEPYLDQFGAQLRIPAARTYTGGAGDGDTLFMEIPLTHFPGETYDALRLVATNEGDDDVFVSASYEIEDVQTRSDQVNEFAGLLKV